MSITDAKSFFSISANYIVTNRELPYDIYINSSSRVESERFVRIFPLGESLIQKDLNEFRRKYSQFYVLESQRDLYLKSLMRSTDVPDSAKADVIKDTAINYLSTLFDDGKRVTNDLLSDAIKGCRDTVEYLVDVVHNYNINQIQDLIGTLSFHDFYTYDHSINVSMYCISILKTYKPHCTRQDQVLIGLGGLLHDMGKIKIPTNIINNPGELTKEEFDLIKKHPEFGAALLVGDIKLPDGIDFSIIKRMMIEHHENIDGTGYPKKLKGDDIHPYSKIAMIADVFDALTTKRSYHKALSTDEAITLMLKSVGKKLDEAIFDTLTKNARKLVRKGTTVYQLPSDFDPGQPHKELQLEKIEANKQAFALSDKKQDFGKIKTDK